MAPPVPAAEIRKVARLARLAVTDDQVERLGRDLAAILGYVERLREIDLAGVEPLAHIGDAVNRLDHDTPGPTLPTQALMNMAPDPMPPFIQVPKVLDEGGGA